MYDGQLFVYSPRKSSLAFISFARQLMEEAFAPMDPETAQRQMPVANVLKHWASTSGKTRSSIDFRLVNIDDVAPMRGAPKMDEQCTGATMHDYLRGTDFSHIPDELLALCDDDTASEGGLVYQHRARA